MAQCVACDSRRRSGDGEPCGSHLRVIEGWVAERDHLKAELDAANERAEAVESITSTEAERIERLIIERGTLQERVKQLEAELAIANTASAGRLGHTSYGEGAVADGPGAPLSVNLVEHIDALDALVSRLVEKHTRLSNHRKTCLCYWCTR